MIGADTALNAGSARASPQDKFLGNDHLSGGKRPVPDPFEWILKIAVRIPAPDRALPTVLRRLLQQPQSRETMCGSGWCVCRGRREESSAGR